jgi:hypothetical protein
LGRAAAANGRPRRSTPHRSGRRSGHRSEPRNGRSGPQSTSPTRTARHAERRRPCVRAAVRRRARQAGRLRQTRPTGAGHGSARTQCRAGSVARIAQYRRRASP